ncbi:MAG: cell division protein FtsZ, partial [Burkholderiales bacterium]|nr:cell division protein FtsZ [Burkholderiales bacterium]
DRACADNDIQVAIHVIGESVEAGDAGQPFQVVRREDGVTLVMDVALTPDLGRSYEAMARTGRDLAALHGARLVDDRGNALDEHSLAAIGAQLEAVRQALAGRGIETGSPLALRLFS